MQQIISDPGEIDGIPVRFRCNKCPRGCITIDYSLNPDFTFHQHPCHRFPSITTDYKRIG